jgi:hypothetical protein
MKLNGVDFTDQFFFESSIINDKKMHLKLKNLLFPDAKWLIKIFRGSHNSLKDEELQ